MNKLVILFLLIFLQFGCAHKQGSGQYVRVNGKWVFQSTDVGFINLFKNPKRDEYYAVEDTSRFLWPVPSSGRISSYYGHRHGRHHDGIDIAANSGSNIVASDNGEVIFSGQMSGYGNIIVVKHSGGYHTVYAHNSKNIARKGSKVSRGEVVALVGSTGRSTGPHLHYEIRRNNKVRDPALYLEHVQKYRLAKQK
jgi:murein DD-endopeptidase MepM/ murein hydrolase activator NlpD